MPRRKVPTSYGEKRENKRGDQKKAGEASADARLLRLRMRQALSRQIQHLEAIADGTARVYRPFGKDAAMIKVAPDFVDRNKAIATLATFGIGTKEEISGPDDGPVRVAQEWTFGGKKVEF